MSTTTHTTLHAHPPEVPVDIGSIPPAVWGAGGAGGMLSLLYWLLATGRLIPRRYYEERVADKDKQIDLLSKTVDVKDDQLGKALSTGETSVKILESIEQLARDRGTP